MHHVQSKYLSTNSMTAFILNQSLITSGILVLTYLLSDLVSMAACQDYLWVIYTMIKTLKKHFK